MQPKALVIWAALVGAMVIPMAAAATSPLLAWREPVYILAGFAGVVAMALLLLQPLLAAGLLPGVSMVRGRRLHRWIGLGLVFALLVHVGGLWITSPPDVVDALLFVSPTPFSVWGVIAMWAAFVAATLALLRHRLRLRPRSWRIAHTSLACVIVLGSVIHAMLIDGTMEVVTKTALCALVLLALAKAVTDLRVWARGPRRKPSAAGPPPS